MREDKGVGTLKAKSIIFVPILVLIVGDYYHIGSIGNRRATSSNRRGRGENGKETAGEERSTRTIFVNRILGGPNWRLPIYPSSGFYSRNGRM